MTHNLVIEHVEVIPGALPDGTRMGKFLIETANLGNLEWMLTPRQALTVAMALEDYAHSCQNKKANQA
jgi:hypothetical protein